jgi:signal transduction histidine kinase
MLLAQDMELGQRAVRPGEAHDLSDLVVFNRWLCISRLRAAAGVVLFVGGLEYLQIGNIGAIPVLAVCAVLSGFSALVLGCKRLQRAPRVLFHGQHLVDLIGVTVGIGAASSGTAALLFRSVYFLVIVPPSLASVRAGLIVASGAGLGHEALLVLERGASLDTVTSLESLVPVFLFFLVAQQCFFYAAHLKEKNAVLAQLAGRLQWSRQRLAGLVDVARTLNSTLNAPELWARVNQAALMELGADCAATFLVNRGRNTFRTAAVTGSAVSIDPLSAAELPMASWPVLARLAVERVVQLNGEDVWALPAFVTGGRTLRAVLLAGLYHDSELLGFLALGYEREATAGETLDHLTAIVEHATIALRNAQLLDDARQASVMKSEFVSTISHELRTPLNVIIGYTDMLRDGAVGTLTTAQREVFERIDTEARGLFELIEATLQVGRIETGRDTVTLERVPMAQLIGALRAAATALPRSTLVAFEWEAPATPSGVMVTDLAKVVLVVRNLVSNALKFTPEGRVTVRLRTLQESLVLTVADTGIGIPEGSLPIIFEMFCQLDNGAERQSRGVGLGLYIVKQMVQRLNGTIAVKSTIGTGSEFRVVLPGYELEVVQIARGAGLPVHTHAPRGQVL